MSQTNNNPRQGGRKPSSMDTPYQFMGENHPLHRHATALVDDLFDAGLAGGKRSHKAQYVRWMLGRVRGDRDGEPTPGQGAYKHPYPEDKRRKPIATSKPLNTPFAGWSPDDWKGQFAPFNPKDVSEAKRSKFIQAMVDTKHRIIKVKKSAPQAHSGKSLDEHIIHLYQSQGMTTRAIVKELQEKYGLSASQPTVARRIKAFNDGKIDATGKKL